MLKDIVDETSWGRYDFMYLRIGEQAVEYSYYSAFQLSRCQILRTTASLYTCQVNWGTRH